MKLGIYILILVLLSVTVYAETSYNFLTKGWGDTLYCQIGGTCSLNSLVVDNLTVNNYAIINESYLNVTGDINITGCVNFPDGSELCGDRNKLGHTNFTGYVGLLGSSLRFWNVVTGYDSDDGTVISLGGDGRSLEISNYEESDVTILVNAHQVAEFSEDQIYVTADIVGTDSIDILGGFELGSITDPGRCINFVSTGTDGVMCWNDVGDYFNITSGLNVTGSIYGNGLCIYDDCISSWDDVNITSSGGSGNCSGTGSCTNITYMNYPNVGNLSISPFNFTVEKDGSRIKAGDISFFFNRTGDYLCLGPGC